MEQRTRINSLIDSLSLDHKRGAAEIVADAESLFGDIGKLGLTNPASGFQVLTRAVSCMTKGQPSMAPVLNLLNQVCLCWENSGEMWEQFLECLAGIRGSFTVKNDLMISSVDRLPKVNGVLMTYSNSSTVTRMIIESHKQFGLPEKVFCGEGRPVMEGLIMAKKLSAGGLDVTLFTDAALMSRIVEVDAVWVGGDSLSHHGLVNKTGSCALALLADKVKVPFISLMGTDKLLSTQMTDYLKLLPQNPREIAALEGEEYTVVNEYYETIPLKLIKYVFTERGLSKPASLLSTCENNRISSFFRQLAAG